jgi:threonine dehydrogenase-like Zn-dependent dehydrogenase
MSKIRDLTCLSDILPTGFHGALNAGVGPGTTVYVAGAGPVSLAAAASAQLLGAAVTIVGDVNKERLKHARSVQRHGQVHAPVHPARLLHTIRGTRADAKALERKFEDAKRKGEYVGPLERKTFEEVANLFQDEPRANNRRMSTLEEYQTELKIRLLP